MTNLPDDRSQIARAMEWTSRILAIALEMSLPSLGGYWLDQRLGTKFLFVMLGAVFGLGAGMWHLIRLTQSMGPQRRKREPSDKTTRP